MIETTYRRSWRPATMVLAGALLVTLGGWLARAAEPASQATTTQLVGVLTEQAYMVCNGSPEPRWVEPYWEVGFVRIDTAAGVDPKPLEGRPVIVEGEVSRSLVAPPTVVHTGPCFPPQMRSDWVQGPKGMRMQRGGGAGLPGFRAQAVRAFDGLSVRTVDGELEVTLANPFEFALTDVTFAMHYEGCYGKPGTATRKLSFSKLAAGKSLTARFPILDEEPAHGGRSRAHRAWSIQVSAPTGAVAWDLDVRVNTFPGVDVECPRPGGDDRGGRKATKGE